MRHKTLSWDNSFVYLANTPPKELPPIFKPAGNGVKATTLFSFGGHADDWKRMREEIEAKKGFRHAYI